MPRLAALLLLASLSTACKRSPPPRPDREVAADVLQGVLAFPRSTVVNVASGADAAQATLSTPSSVQTVATWYRQVLRLNGWDLQSDAVTNDGSIAIYAQQGNRPLWITIKATAGGVGATYTLIGAELPKDTVPDSRKDSAAQRSGSSMSSNRIQRR